MHGLSCRVMPTGQCTYFGIDFAAHFATHEKSYSDNYE